MTDVVAEHTAVGRADARPGNAWIADAPAHADEVLATVEVLPRWVGLVGALGGSLVLWAAIIIGLRWALAHV